MDGTLDAELEVQRTINRAELTAFWCLFRKHFRSNYGSCGQQRDHRWAVERRDEMYWSESKRCQVEFEHVKAHRSKKERQQMSLFEKCFSEGNEQADELAKGGAMLDGGFWAQARASTVQHKKRRR